MNTKQLLEQRAKTHGEFSSNAGTAQAIKACLHDGDYYQALSDMQKEALDMIASKLARIVNGDAGEQDHFKDIIGYSTLALRSMQNQNR